MAELFEAGRYYSTWSLLGIAVICLAIYTWQQGRIIINKPGKVERLFMGFRAKIWMTIGLGIFFFTFYALLIFFSARFVDNQTGAVLFTLGRQSPKLFIYIGLLIFASISLSIYLVRMVIKYLFLTRGKGE